VSTDENLWGDGRRAWRRLDDWQQVDSVADGDDALGALTDIGLIRRVLEHAELVAVRTARRQGKSWSEIATMLGVTRQSAWERWRDLDDATVGTTSEPGAGPSAAMIADPGGAAVGSVETAEAISEAAREQIQRRLERRRSTQTVPDVVGLGWEAARQMLSNEGLVAVGSDGGPPSSSTARVTDQSPEAGATVPTGSMVRLWTERGGGGAGVREPRRPVPVADSGRDEPRESFD